MNPFPAAWEVGAALLEAALLLVCPLAEVTLPVGCEVPVSPDVSAGSLVSLTDDSSREAGTLLLLPPILKEQAVSMPKERMETNKVFLFIFVFTVKNRYFPFFLCVLL